MGGYFFGGVCGISHFVPIRSFGLYGGCQERSSAISGTFNLTILVSRVLIVIPARYGSTRFLGKPLALIAGVSLIERVYRLCCQVGRVSRVIVATDDSRIERHVLKFGGQVMMTRRDHPSGTDRVAEVARHHSCSMVINVQGDEPLLDPRVIRKLINTMRRNPSIPVATLCHATASENESRDLNIVKVVVGCDGNALYFSRAPIPYHYRTRSSFCMRRHIGIYAYRRRFLLKYVRWPQTPLEKVEGLEQLRALERGVRIRVLETSYHALGVDVPEDVAKVEEVLMGKK